MSNMECRQEGCTRHPSKGDLIVRTSPKGEPFEGYCEEHYPGNPDPVVGRIAGAFQRQTGKEAVEQQEDTR